MKIRYILTVAVLSALMFTSCFGDLDTKPLNETDFTSEKAYSTPESYKQGLAKIYGSFVLVGKEAGEPDIAVKDAGASELNRSFWSLQEISTDAVKNAWNDPWVKEINTATWSTAKNDAIFAAYNRIMMAISYVNEYLRQTSDGKLSGRGVGTELYNDIQNYRAEARFLRAYAWWMGLDLFENMPFVTENDPLGSFYPPQYSGEKLFEYIESELLDLVSETSKLKESKTNVYPRVDKTAAWGLLARMYLNAEVYTGTAKWNEAKNAAANAIGGSYGLADNYEALFRGDNGQNPDTRKELIFAIDYDHNRTKSFGGTSFLVCASVSNGDEDTKKEVGSTSGWAGNRMPGDFALKYFSFAPGDINYTQLGFLKSNDKRAKFWLHERTKDIEDLNVFEEGWGVLKFSNNAFLSSEVMSAGAHSSIDYPMIRMGEIYLIYAEAVLRAGGGSSSADATALGYLNGLRERAQEAYTPVMSYDMDYIKAERVRELYWEGHRRTDLRRYGEWLSGSFKWSWKGGLIEGGALDARYDLYPIPVEDLGSNHNLEQNPGYVK